MLGNERIDTKGGPFGNLSQAYFSNLDAVVKSLEPALKGAGRLNLEVIGLMTRRSQAWLEIPSRLGRCKTPIDLFNEHVRFWQTAVADYSEGSRRLASAWGACTALPKLNGALPRDYITFPEPKEGAPAAKPGERKAA
jgi:hypothetical protein